MIYRQIPALVRSDAVDMAFSESLQLEPEHRMSFRNPVTRFERLAAAAEEFPGWPALLDILLGTVAPSSWGGHEVLWPLWADEAMHRARCMMDQTLRLERRVMQQGNHAAWSASCIEKAIALADTLAELRIVDDVEVLPCAGLLGKTAAGLLSLFSLHDADLDGRIVLEDIALPAYKRRALILATSTLVMQMVSSVMDRGFAPIISVELSAQGSGQYRLAITTDAARLDEDARESDDIVDGLADLLAAQNVRRLRGVSEAVTEIEFPGPERLGPQEEAAELRDAAPVHCRMKGVHHD